MANFCKAKLLYRKRFRLLLHIYTQRGLSAACVCRLSHSCTLVKMFQRFKCHLTGTCGVQQHIVSDGWWSLEPNAKGRLGGRTTTPTTIDQRFCHHYQITVL